MTIGSEGNFEVNVLEFCELCDDLSLGVQFLAILVAVFYFAKPSNTQITEIIQI